jgi:5'(3')-deoxyribonucleotidase
MTYYIDMDGVIANFHKEKYSYANAINRQWIASLEPFTHNVNVIKNLIATGNTIYILTKAASENARLGKIDWLAKYLPEITIDRFICIVGNGKKVDYIREDGTLIDDDKKNTTPWEKAGHRAILLASKGELIRV